MSDDQLLRYIKEAVDRIEKKQDKHEERIGLLERWQSDANGKITASVMFSAGIAAVLTGLIEYFRK